MHINGYKTPITDDKYYKLQRLILKRFSHSAKKISYKKSAVKEGTYETRIRYNSMDKGDWIFDSLTQSAGQYYATKPILQKEIQ